MRRLDAAVKKRGQSKQAFVQEFTMAAVTEYEQGKLTARDKKQRRDPDEPVESSGLGLVAAMKAKEPSSPIEVVQPSTAPVVVQVGNGTPANGTSAPLGELDRLAIYIIKGDDFMREMRKRTSIEILRATAATDEEFNVLVARLEEIIAIKSKTIEENSGVNRLARMAFDKLTSLLRGE